MEMNNSSNDEAVRPMEDSSIEGGSSHTQESQYDVSGVTSVLRDVQFPISKDSLLQQYGDSEIVVKDQETTTLRRCLETEDQQEFNSMHEVVDATQRSAQQDLSRSDIYGGSEQDPYITEDGSVLDQDGSEDKRGVSSLGVS
jgi:hypothetical protein